MTHLRTMFTGLFAGAVLASGCGTSDGDVPGDLDGDGTPDVGDGDYTGGNNDGGPDSDDEGGDVEPTYPTAHPRIFIDANRARLEASLDAGTPAATRFRQTVDRWVGGQEVWGFQVWNAALLGQLTSDPKYCTKAVQAIDAQVASEEANIAAGQKPYVAGNSYLEVGGVIGDLALVYDWCHDDVSAAQKARWLDYANQTVWNVWNPTQAKYGNTAFPWTGWSIDNPSNNYYYSFLRATMLLGLAAMGEDSRADGWVKQFRETKVLGQLVPVFDKDLRGGGSREGTAYGVSHRHLFNLYDFWYATTGEKLQAKTKHARQSLRTAMHQVVPTLDRIVPTGDQPRDKAAMFFDYQRHYLQQLIEMYPNDKAAGRAKSLLAASNLPVMARPEMLVYDFLYDMEGVEALPLEQMATDHYASGIGQLYSRSGWDKQATWVNLTGGPYTESHAHQDQGALMIYKEGWLAGDGVLGSTNGIIQDTTSHSLVRITSGGNTIKQHVNTLPSMVGLHRGKDWIYAAVDTTAAYKGAPEVGKVQREMVYLKPDVVIVYDRVTTKPGTSQIWQLSSPIRPAVSGATATIAGTHALTVQRLAPANAASAPHDMAGTAGYVNGHRLDTTVAGGDVRYLHVLSLDGAVASATADGDSGVTVKLADGNTASVKFQRDTVGASLTYGGVTTALGPGIDEIAE